MSYPVFASGDVLNASDMNAVGLWLVKTQTIGSAVSSVTVTSCFTSDYDNYRIVIANVAATNADFLTFTLSGATGTSYAWGATFTQYTGITLTTVSGGSTSARVAVMGGKFQAAIEVGSPFLSAITTFNSTSASDGYSWQGGGYNSNTTSSTGFTISPAAGTLTGGTIKVYGYRN